MPFDFYDVAFKASYQNLNPDFIDDGKFTIHGFFSGDQMINSDPYLDDYKWRNDLLGFKRFQVYDIPLFSEISLSVSNYQADVKPKLSGNRPKRNKVQEVDARADFTYVYESKDELGIGMIFKGLRTELKQVNEKGVDINLQDFGGNVVIYGKYKYLRNENFGLDAGVRVNLEAYKRGGSFYFEPRLNFTYRILSTLALKGSWGLFQQGITTIYDESEVVSVFEPWFIIPGYLKPARAIHYNIGFDLDMTDYASLKVEGYYKVLQHLPTLNDEKQFIDDPDLVEGNGESYGWEFSTEVIKDPVYFSLSYTLSWAYKTVNGWKYYPRYDSRHSVKALLDFNLGKGWQAGATWIFYTGFPFTPQIGFYYQLRSDDFTNWDIYENYAPQVILGDKNVNRLPNYHRLDLTLSKSFSIGGVKFKTEINVLNVYDRQNMFYFDRETGERVNMMPFLATAGIRIQI